MPEEPAVATPSGLAVLASDAAAAEELAALVRAATRDLPFGAEPAAFLVTLERLAAQGEDLAVSTA